MPNARSIRKLFLVLAIVCLVAPLSASADGGVTYHEIAAGGGHGLVYTRTPSVRLERWNTVADPNRLFSTLTDFEIAPPFPHGVPGVAVLDYDNDGDLDIYVTNGPDTNNSLFQNQLADTGEFTFVDVGAASGAGLFSMDSQGVCYGDIDNDGDVDLYVGNHDAPNSLLENQGDGTFVDISAASGAAGGERTSLSCSMGDVNNDGLLDIVVANAFEDFNSMSYAADPFSFTEADDLFINLGGNTFADMSDASGIRNLEIVGVPPDTRTLTWATALVDYDQDGDVDLILATDQAGLPAAKFGGIDLGLSQLFANDGTGHFTNVREAAGLFRPSFKMAHEFGDLNCDGLEDFYATNFGDYAALIAGGWEDGDLRSSWAFQQPDHSFIEPTGPIPNLTPLGRTSFGWGMGLPDYDNDGDLDILHHGGFNAVLADWMSPGIIITNLGQCSGTFDRDLAAMAETIDHNPRGVTGVATGDLNQDGFLDVVSVASMVQGPDFPAIPMLALGINRTGPFDDDAFFGGLFAPIDDTFTNWAYTGTPYMPGNLAVEMNSGDNGNGSIFVDTVGAVGILPAGGVNRDGIGAVLSVTPKPSGATVTRSVLGGGNSFLSQHDLTQHFGLGDGNRAVVDVMWPGGVRNRLYNVREGQHVVLPEIPCSYDDPDFNVVTHALCVIDALDGLLDHGVINRRDRARLLISQLQAFHGDA